MRRKEYLTGIVLLERPIEPLASGVILYHITHHFNLLVAIDKETTESVSWRVKFIIVTILN